MISSAKELINKSFALCRMDVKLFLTYAGIMFIPTAIGIIINNTLTSPATNEAATEPIALVAPLAVKLIFGLLGAFVSFWVSIAMVRAFANKYNNSANLPAWEMELKKAGGAIVPAAIATILAGLIILAGFFLFLIPGIIFSLWYAFAFHAAVLDGKKNMAAVHASKDLVKGKWWAILWRIMAPAFVFGAGVMVAQFVVGIVLGIAIAMSPSFLARGLQTLLELIASALAFASIPLTTGVSTILYLELKKMPAPQAIPTVSVS